MRTELETVHHPGVDTFQYREDIVRLSHDVRAVGESAATEAQRCYSSVILLEYIEFKADHGKAFTGKDGFCFNTGAEKGVIRPWPESIIETLSDSGYCLFRSKRFDRSSQSPVERTYIVQAGNVVSMFVRIKYRVCVRNTVCQKLFAQIRTGIDQQPAIIRSPDDDGGSCSPVARFGRVAASPVTTSVGSADLWHAGGTAAAHDGDFQQIGGRGTGFHCFVTRLL